MAKLISNRNLLILFGGLLAVVAGIQLYQSQQEDEAAIRETTIDPVDSARLSRIQLIPQFADSKAYSLVPTDTGWQVKGEPEETINQQRLTRAMDELKAGLPISHLVSRDQDEWSEHQVDSSGTLLRVYQDGNLHSEAILGETTFNQKQRTTTYVRPKGATSVYVVNAYLQGSLAGSKSDWLQPASTPGRQQITPKMRRKLRQMRQQKQGQP
jgi:hypothetical protein